MQRKRRSSRLQSSDNDSSAATCISELGDFTELWKRMSRQHRAQLLSHLTQSLMDSSEAHFLHDLVRRRLQLNPLSELPLEVQLRVLDHVSDARTLIIMAMSCRHWFEVIMSHVRIWKHRIDPNLKCMIPPNLEVSESVHEFTENNEELEEFQDNAMQIDSMSPMQSPATPVEMDSDDNDTLSVFAKESDICTNKAEVHHSSLCIAPEIQRLISVVQWQSKLKSNWMHGTWTRHIPISAHNSSVITCLYLDEKCHVAISGSDNGSICVWDLITGERRALLEGHQGGVWALKANSTGLLVTGSTDRSLIVWDFHRQERLWDLVGHSSTVRCVKIAGPYVVSGSRDGTLRVWDPTTGRCVHILTGHTASVRCLCLWKPPKRIIDQYCSERGLSKLDPSIPFIVSGSYDGTVRVWDVHHGECVSVCGLSNSAKIYAVASSERYVFSGGMDTKIRVWDPCTGKLVDEFSDHSALVGILTVSDGVLVAGSTDGSISVWDAQRLVRLRHLEAAHNRSITALEHNGEAIISGSERAIKLWPMADFQREFEDSSSLERNWGDGPSPRILIDKVDVVWRIAVGRLHVAMGYQQGGSSRIDIFSFAP